MVVLQCPTWKFILDILEFGYKPSYLLAIGHCLSMDRASKMMRHALEYDAISQNDYAQFAAVLEKRV